MPDQQQQFYQRILKLIQQYRMIERGDRIVVGVSGGIDSVVLLYALQRLQSRLDIHLYAAHLNHQFRGPEADRDAEFVRRLSEQFQISCFVETRNVPALIAQKKLSPQDAARQVRYQFFETIARQVNAQKIATAHTADDQAETLLIGLIRGVGLHGLGGIQPVLNQRIIRPLLTTTRDQIESFAQAEGLQSVLDSSNLSRKYLRNAVRLDLLPLLKRQFNPAIVKRLTAYTQLFREDAFFIDKIAAERYTYLCEQAGDAIQIQLERFAREERTLQRAIIYKGFETLTGTRQGLETEHVRAVIELFTRKKTGKMVSLPGGVIAARSYRLGYLQHGMRRSLRISPPAATIAVPGHTLFDDFRIETELRATLPSELRVHEDMPTTSTFIQGVDAERLVFPITVRYRLPGDYFRPLGMSGKKTLKKFFIDRKVPHDTRDSIPLFEDKNGIFWVVGHAIDARVKVAETTRSVLLCRVTRR